jgi:hypothetical protein
MAFQYDPTKAALNLKKHGVSFSDAEGVFYDPLATFQTRTPKARNGSLPWDWEAQVTSWWLYIHCATMMSV